MAPSPSKQRLLIAIGWVATAVVAYSIGSLRTPSVVTVASESSAASDGSVTVVSDSREADDAGIERPLDGLHGAAARSLPEIVGNQSLADYLKRVLALEDDIKRTTAFLEVLETLKTPEQIREALEAVVKSGRGWGRGASSREFSMLLQKWTGMDPNGAAEYALKATGREERYIAMSNVLRTWTRQDATTALAWAQANGANAFTDPSRPENRSDGNYAVSMVVAQIAKTDIDAAMRVAATGGDGQVSTRLADNLTEELFRQRGPEAARDAILGMPASKLRESMLGEYADTAAKTDGPGIARWAAALPESSGRSRALAEAVSSWAGKDPVNAAAFLNSLPVSPGTDAARERFARDISSKDPAGAIEWAKTISTERQRQDATENLIQSWLRRDAESARTWVMQSAFSDEMKQRLLAPAPQRGRN